MAPKRIGRPPLYETPTTHRLYLNVTATQHADVHRVARDNRMSVSHVIREAVNAFVADYGDRSVFPPKRG